MGYAYCRAEHIHQPFFCPIGDMDTLGMFVNSTHSAWLTRGTEWALRILSLTDDYKVDDAEIRRQQDKASAMQQTWNRAKKEDN